MAEGLCRKVLPRLIGCREEDLPRLKINIASAGTFAMWNLPPSRNAVAVMNKMGINLSDHRSQPVTATLASQADLIFVMSPEHKDFICDLVPGMAHRVILLSESGVADPIGGSDDVYFKCAQNLERLIEARLKELL
jgi:protein-tyrosine phosphatase